jgi:chromosome segregation ATPase
MARGGINKAVVRIARDALIARGVHPSIDAVRVELGNTGSKSTIQLHLKELVTPVTSPAPTTLSAELIHYIESVAERVTEEARLQVAGEQAQVDEAWRRHEQTQAQQRELIQALHEQGRLRDGQIDDYQRREAALQKQLSQQRTACEDLNQQHNDLQQSLNQHAATITSLQERNDQLKTQLEHFRQQQRSQRDQELERHDQQVQQLRIEQQSLQNTLLQKQEELVGLYRDQERLMAERRLETKQAHAELQQVRQTHSQYEQEAEGYRQHLSQCEEEQTRRRTEQAQQRLELTELTSRLRAALQRQRSDAHALRKEQKRVHQLQELLGTKISLPA